MAFKVKPFAEVVAMTSEELDVELAPIRARAARAKADLACSKLEETLVTLERRIYEACASKDINFDAIGSLIDQYELTDRKRSQIGKLLDGLFPAPAK